MGKMPKVLLLGLFDTAVATARCLRPHGAKLIGVDFDPSLSGFSSRLIKPFLIPCRPEEEMKAVHFIIDVIKAEGGRVIAIPTSDQFVLLLSKYRQAFSPYADFLIPGPGSVETVIRRGQQFEAARQAGLAVPEYVSGPVACESILGRSWPFPVVVKPSNIVEWQKHFRKKGFVIYDPGELAAVLAEVNAKTSCYLVQKVIPGDTTRNYEVNSLYLPDGRLIQHTIHKLRQYPDLFGTATCIENHPDEALEAMAARFIRQNGLFGFTNIEFKYSEADQACYYIETNTRVWLQINFSKSLGFDFAGMYYAYLGGRHVAQTSPRPAAKGKWVDPLPDTLFWIKHRLKYNLSFFSFLKSWFPLKATSLFSFSDPLPFLKELKLGKRLLRFLKQRTHALLPFHQAG